MKYTFNENCKACQDMKFKDNTKKFWYDQWKFLKEMIRWEEIAFYIGIFLVSYLIFGFIWALIIFFALSKLVDFMDMGIIDPSYPEKKYPPNVCSAGIEGCQICDNPYSHEFNINYKKRFKWYNVL